MTRDQKKLSLASPMRPKNLAVVALAALAFLLGIGVRSYAAETLRFLHPGSLMGSLEASQFQLTLISLLTVLNLGFVVAGIYGAMSYTVTARTQEIGLLLAHGARMRDVMRLVVWHGMKLMGFGTVIGLSAAVLFARWIKVLLVGVDATDPLTFAAVTVVLGATAFIVTYLPMRRTAPLLVRSE